MKTPYLLKEDIEALKAKGNVVILGATSRRNNVYLNGVIQGFCSYAVYVDFTKTK